MFIFKLEEEVKLSLSVDDMILYTENLKDSTQKLLELTNELSNIAGHKINIQKLVAFLYTNNEIAERECRKTIPFRNDTNELNKTERDSKTYKMNLWLPGKG